MKQKHFSILIPVLAVVLILLIALAVRLSRPETPPESIDQSSQQTQNTIPTDSVSPTENAPTKPVETTQSTEPPTTTPLPTTPEPTDPTETTVPIQPTEPAPTQPPVTTQPTQPPVTTPPTQPGVSGEYIGSLYTRDQLMAMSNEKFGYGPGPASKDQRAIYAVADQQRYEKYGANFIAPDNNCIYLTFDCGYEYTATDANGNKYRVTERILDVLKEKNVKGVFFVTMYYVKSQPDLVQRMIDEGHAVGNHTNNHPVMPDISIDKMVEEVMSLHNYVLDNFGYKMTLFRPPTGAFSVRSLAVVQSLGYKNVHWSFAYMDWETESQPETTAALQRVKSYAHSGAIYLLHAISTTNASILPDAIDFFKSEGYQLELFQ